MIFNYLCAFWVTLICVQQNVSPARGHLEGEAIIGGYPAANYDFPYQVALFRKEKSKIICGGVIIKPRVVFTAAHCTYENGTVLGGLVVLAGATYIGDPAGQLVNIEKAIKHPLYTDDAYDNDFSILLLKDPIKFGKNAGSIEISEDGDQDGNIATVSGWGRIKKYLPSRNLRAVQLRIEQHSKCQNYFPEEDFGNITDNMICVKPNRKGAYYGDSGGPLTVDGKLVGLVSFGNNVKPDKMTAVYTRVKQFRRFADEVIPEEYKSD